MKSISSEDSTKDSAQQIPGIPLNIPPTNYSTANRRSASISVQRVYPWLLFVSTAIAATFCLAYITKPVIITSPPSSVSSPGQNQVASSGSSKSELPQGKIIPDPNYLPGDGVRPTAENAGGKTPATAQKSDYEETNIRVQHILDAESENGEIDRIIVDVPVLYRTRNLRWTQQEAAEARELLDSLTAHQEKTRTLRDESAVLLDSWNRLMGISIPSDALRADSPSLPSNQFDPLAPEGAGAEDTIETIKLSIPEE